MAAKKKPSRSGTTWTDADYAKAGYGRITLRLPLATLEVLERLSEQRGCSRAEAVDDAVREALRRETGS